MASDPFDVWSRWLAAGSVMAATQMRAAETLWASGDVIARRTALMRAGEPAQAMAESARMVLEKVMAFSRAGATIAAGWSQVQADMFVETQRFAAMAWRGRAPSYRDLSAMTDRQAALALALTEAGTRLASAALAPVHRAATANARRLSRPQHRRGSRAKAGP